MPRKQLTTLQQVEDFVRGGLFFGAGGSCLPEKAIASICRVLDAGRDIGWVDFSDLPDDAIAFSAWGMGSPAERGDEILSAMSDLGLTESNEKYNINDQLEIAVRELRLTTGKDLSVLVSPEISDSTTAATLVAAALNDLLVVDGSYMTRAIPEIPLTNFSFQKNRTWPIASCDGWGNVCVIKQCFSDQTAELVGKLISQAGFGLVGMAGFIIEREDLEEALIPGTLTDCLEVGRALRLARDGDGDPIKKILIATGGREICRGRISQIQDRSDGGYNIGTVTVDTDQGEFSYWFKNENFVVWKNGVPHVTGPDIITAIDLESFEPIANQVSYVGQQIVLVGVPIQPVMRRDEVYEALGPRAFGFDFDYQPVDSLSDK